MARIHTDRQTRFKAALAVSKMTVTDFAANLKPRPVHRVHLNAVLRGDRESPRLIKEVDRFIESVETRFRAKTGAEAA